MRYETEIITDEKSGCLKKIIREMAKLKPIVVLQSDLEKSDFDFPICDFPEPFEEVLYTQSAHVEKLIDRIFQLRPLDFMLFFLQSPDELTFLDASGYQVGPKEECLIWHIAIEPRASLTFMGQSKFIARDAVWDTTVDLQDVFFAEIALIDAKDLDGEPEESQQVKLRKFLKQQIFTHGDVSYQ